MDSEHKEKFWKELWLVSDRIVGWADFRDVISDSVVPIEFKKKLFREFENDVDYMNWHEIKKRISNL